MSPLKYSLREKWAVIWRWALAMLVVIALLVVYAALAGPYLSSSAQSPWGWLQQRYQPFTIWSALDIAIYITLAALILWLLADFEYWDFDIDGEEYTLAGRFSAAMVMLALYLGWNPDPNLILPQIIVYPILWFGIVMLQLASAEMAENEVLVAMWFLLALALPVLAMGGWDWFARSLVVLAGGIFAIVRVVVVSN